MPSGVSQSTASASGQQAIPVPEYGDLAQVAVFAQVVLNMGSHTLPPPVEEGPNSNRKRRAAIISRAASSRNI